MLGNPRVLLLIETSSSWGSGIVRGVHEWLADRKVMWEVQLVWHGRHEMLHVPRGWSGDGILARVTSEALARELLACKVPVVNVSTIARRHIPQVTMDEREVGRSAFGHLRGLGLRQMAYLGPMSLRRDYRDAVGPSFGTEALAAGIPCRVLETPPLQAAPEEQIRRLCAELASVPTPMGVLAWGAEEGRHVLDAAARMGLRVPLDVSVVCGENDELLCGIAMPGLTAVDPGPRAVGAAAARELARMMGGRPAPAAPLLLPVAGVTVRGSTDVLAVADPILSQALAFLRLHLHRPVQVADLAAAAGVSRRTLESRFLEILGRSPAAEIRRLKVDAARRLLMDSALPLGQVARQAGFASEETLRRNFVQEIGETPAAWRRRAGHH